MAGMPKRRARREAEARQALTTKSDTRVALPDGKYSDEIAEEITDLIASGVSIDDTLVGETVAVKGVATRVNVSPTTIYRWQKKNPEFAGKIKAAREESAHRYADRIASLADVALDNPALANAVRVAGELLRWSAMVRNRPYYGDKAQLDLKHDGAPLINITLAPLRESLAKVIEPEAA